MGQYVYILRCSDGSLYVGHTQDLASRIDLHNRGAAAKWTAARRPVSLVYEEQHPSEQRAIERERQLKHWSRQKKQALVSGDLADLKGLAKRRKP